MKTNKNKSIIAIVSCIVLFLVICSAFVINYNIKGTRAAATGCSSGYKVPASNGNSYCCPNSTDSIVSHGGTLYCMNSNYSNTTTDFEIKLNSNGETICIDYVTVDTENTNICKTTFGSNWIIANDPVYNAINYKYTYTCSSSCATPVKALDVEDPSSSTEVTLKITYHTNDPNNKTTNDNVIAGRSYTIAAAPTPYNSNYTFKEWNTKADGSGAVYSPGFTIVTVSTEYEFYAIWNIEEEEPSSEPPSESETVTNLAIFKDQDHSILHQTSCTAIKGKSCKIYAPKAPTKKGHTFLGWTTTGDNNCNGNYWQTSYWIADGLDFYACWEENGTTSSTSSSSQSSTPESSEPPSNNGGNITENPKTGQIAIIAVWVIGLATIIYSVVYFAKMRKNN